MKLCPPSTVGGLEPGYVWDIEVVAIVHHAGLTLYAAATALIGLTWTHILHQLHVLMLPLQGKM